MPIRDLMNSFDTARGSLAPRLYGTATVELDRLEADLAGLGHAVEAVVPVAPGLLVGVVVDDGRQTARVSQQTLASWGVSLGQALDAAYARLTGRDLPLSRVGQGYMTRDTAYAGSVWARPQLGESLGLPGRLRAYAPTADVCLVGGSGDPEFGRACLGVATALLDQGRTLESTTVCEHHDGAWREVAWAGLGVDGQAACRVTRPFYASLYARQKPLLEETLRRAGDDSVVPDLTVATAPDGRVVSLTTWAEGARALLPVADQLFMVQHTGRVTPVAWADATASWGSLMQPCGLVPERTRVSDFPTL